MPLLLRIPPLLRSKLLLPLLLLLLLPTDVTPQVSSAVCPALKEVAECVVQQEGCLITVMVQL